MRMHNGTKQSGKTTPMWSGLSTLFFLLSSAFAVAEGSGVGEALEVHLSHDTMKMEVGTPAIIKPGGAYPSVLVVSRADESGSLSGEVIREEDGTVVKTFAPQTLRGAQKASMTIEGKPAVGRYRLQLHFTVGDRVVFTDAYYFSVLNPDDLAAGYSLVVHPGNDGKLVYLADYRGNRIPDFSMAGYWGGGKQLPDVPVRVTLAPEPGDATARIQEAIDTVSRLAPDDEGFRGTVLLQKGVYEIGSLKISAGGVVVRGEGPGRDRKALWLDPAAAPRREAFFRSLANQEATILITGRMPLTVAGSGGLKIQPEPVGEILDSYVPVGALTFSIRNPGDFRVGDKVLVRRHGNEAWIRAIGMDRIPGKKPWPPRDANLERIITAIRGHQITINAPVVTAIESRWGGGDVCHYDDPGRISRVGVENLRMIQYCLLDEKVGLGKYRGNAITFDNVQDGWVRDVVAEHYYDNGTFLLGENTSHITVRDSSALLADDKYTAGYVPRYGFKVGKGGNATLHLVENCYALNYRHAYYVDYLVTGPNVFHHCVGEQDVTNSEPHQLWSSGGLFDNFRGSLALMNRLTYGSGHGWAGANYVAWNTRGSLVCERPPTAQNWAIGHTGFKLNGPFHDWRPPGEDSYDGGGDGYWERHRDPVRMGVEASDHGWSRAPEGTLDDNPYTYWMAEGRNEWIQYDLQKPQKVSALKISFPTFSTYAEAKTGDEPPPGPDRVYFFDIAVSEDGKNWRTVYEDGQGAAKGHDVFHQYEFAEVEARFVRILAKGCNVGKSGNKGSTIFHLSRVLILPEPQFAPVESVPEVKPGSLYLQQLIERYPTIGK